VRTIATYNEFHYGDNAIHLHFTRQLALKHPEILFRHHCHPCYHADLLPMTQSPHDNIELLAMDVVRGVALNVWKNAGGYWQHHPLRNDWAAFHLDWFAYLCRIMKDTEGYQWGLQSPITLPEHLLWDHPGLVRAANLHPTLVWPETKPDVLVINSQPCSGQAMAYDGIHYLDLVILRLMEKGLRVITTEPTGLGVPSTRDYGMSLTEIGTLSIELRRGIVGVATGPMWPTFNIWNRGLKRVILLDTERLNLPVPTWYARNVGEVLAHVEREF
jgi:hypothetical protein